MFVSVDGKSQEVTEIFAGGSDGKAHKITELFGSVNGVAKRIYTLEKETNAFNQFTWAEIKQLANEGKLLEHFKQFDKVEVKLKEPLRNDMQIYILGLGKNVVVPQIQTSMVFQIAEVTETSMRLMSPRVNVLGTASSELEATGSVSRTNPHLERYEDDFSNNKNSARNNSYVSCAWGMTAMYDDLKAIQNALPDDLVDVLSVCARPLIQWENHSISGSLIRGYDEDMKVRQLSDDILSKGIDTSNGEVFYPIINKSYFPTSVGEYLYHIRLPEEYDTYEQRRYMVKNTFKGFSFLDHKASSSNYGRAINQSYVFSPYVTCYFAKGIINNDEYEDYRNTGSVIRDTNPPATVTTVFPEVVIEADA